MQFKQKIYENDYDIFIGCESWLDHRTTNNSIIGGYNIYRNDRNRHGGGLVIGVKKSIKSIYLFEFNEQNNQSIKIINKKVRYVASVLYKLLTSR